MFLTQSPLHHSHVFYSCFHDALTAIHTLAQEHMRLPSGNAPTSRKVAASPQYAPYFSNCVGAIDGTKIPVLVPLNDSGRFRDRFKSTSQSVMATCTLDGMFTFVLAGWEGTAHDGAVLRDAIERHGFYVPPGKFYLADAGYGLTEYFLTPYRGERYHLQEYARGRNRYTQ